MADPEDNFVFVKENLPNVAFPAMEQIRRQGKLCDITIKVSLGQLTGGWRHMQNRTDTKGEDSFPKLVRWIEICSGTGLYFVQRVATPTGGPHSPH